MKPLTEKYRTPECKIGGTLFCRLRDRDVKVSRISDAPIQWPIAAKTGRASLILCGDLLKAVRVESEQDIAEAWRVSITTVWKWRKALGVGRVTPGTSKKLARNADSWHQSDECAEVLAANARSESQRKSSSERLCGRPAVPTVRAALLKSAKKAKPPAHRRAIKLANRRAVREGRLKPPAPERPWTAREDRMLGQTLDRTVAEMIGRTIAAVRGRRKALNIPMSRHARLHQEKRH